MNVPNLPTSEIILNLQFANPKLAEIAIAFQIKSAESFWKSILYEIFSWLLLPLGVFVYLGSSFLLSKIFVVLESFLLHQQYELQAVNNIVGIPHYLLHPLIALACYLFTLKFFFRTRRLAKRYRFNALSNLSKDSRDPILYLRSFSADKTEKSDHRSLKTYEEDLVLSLRSIGPLIAIGKPDEDISPLGTNRIYLKNDAWQQNVKRLMTISRLIVIDAGYSAGLLWEIRTALQNITPTKLLISFLEWRDLDEGKRSAQYEKFMDFIGPESSGYLPNNIEDASFMLFTNDGRPELVKPGKWNELFYKFSASLLVNEHYVPLYRSVI